MNSKKDYLSIKVKSCKTDLEHQWVKYWDLRDREDSIYRMLLQSKTAFRTLQTLSWENPALKSNKTFRKCYKNCRLTYEGIKREYKNVCTLLKRRKDTIKNRQRVLCMAVNELKNCEVDNAEVS